MSASEQTRNRWQFGIRELLHATAYACIIAGAYRIDPPIGLLVAIFLAALVGGRLLRRNGTDSESQRTYGALGSMAGGAIAGSGQCLIYIVVMELSGPREDSGLGLVRSILFGCWFSAGYGGIFGLFAWIMWHALIKLGLLMIGRLRAGLGDVSNYR